jgi:hypothetical protein
MRESGWLRWGLGVSLAMLAVAAGGCSSSARTTAPPPPAASVQAPPASTQPPVGPGEQSVTYPDPNAAGSGGQPGSSAGQNVVPDPNTGQPSDPDLNGAPGTWVQDPSQDPGVNHSSTP